MKNNGKTIFLIILLTIIVFFLSMFLVFTLKNGLNFKSFVYKFGNFNTKEAKVVFEKIYEKEEFNNIKINYDYGDIAFKESLNETIQVEILGDEEDEFNVTVDNEILNISYKTKTKNSFLNFNNVKRNIIISVPKNYSNKIAIKTDYGDCKFLDLENAELNIDCDYGDIEVGKIKNITVKCDYGDVRIKEILNKCDIESDYGDVKIEKMSIKEDSDIKVDCGDIKIQDAKDINVEADVDLGEKKIDNINRKSEVTLKIKCDLGDVKVN